MGEEEWANKKSRGNSNPDDIKKFLILAGEIFYKKKDFQPVKKDFEKAIIELSASYPWAELYTIDECEKAIDALKQCSLIEIVLEPDLSFEGIYIEHLKPRLPPLWGWHIAQYLRRCLINSIAEIATDNAGIKKFEKELQDVFHHSTSFEILPEYILAFFLLQLETGQKVAKGSVKTEESIDSFYVAELWQLCLDLTSGTCAAACFAAPKASSLPQKKVEQWRSGSMEDQDKWRVLFAYLYFVGASFLRSEFTIKSRFKLLQPHYSAIKYAGLADYFVFAVSRLLEKELKNGALLEALPYLEGCETIGVARKVAETAIYVLVRNERCIKDQLKSFLGYLSGCGSQAEAEYKSRKHESHHLRYYFREWLLREFCMYLVNNDKGYASFEHTRLDWPQKIYNILCSQYWYGSSNSNNKGKDGISPMVRFEMQREANIALGTWYRRNKANKAARDSFVNFLWQLMGSTDPHEQEIVPYIIRHTEPIPKWTNDSNVRDEPLVDYIFRPILKELLKHGEIPETMMELKVFIKINLSR